MTERIDSIIFDLDGTLVDSRVPVRQAWAKAVEQITGTPWEISDEEYNALFGQPMDVIARALFPQEEDEAQRLAKAQLCYDAELELLEEVPPLLFPGVKETLEKLHKKYPLYIVSNCQKGYIEVCTRKTGIHHLFSGHLCYGDTLAPKSVTLKKLMEEHHLAHPVYVGDTQGDADACKEAQVPFIQASYGFGEVEKPRLSIERFAQMKKAVKCVPAVKITPRLVIREILSWVVTLGIPVAAILLCNAFVGKLVIVNGTSMFPTLYDGDLLLVQTMAYTPQQGDIVICATDPDGPLEGENVVKRCIATQGQTVTINYEDNTVTVDGVVLEEPYLNTSYGDTMMSGFYEDATYVVPEGYIFVLGDNRNNSTDSRSSRLGMVPVENVIGGEVLDLPLGHLVGDNENP
jgi:phosphoglycolate phosphatase